MLEKLSDVLIEVVKTDKSHQWLMANEITNKIIFKTAQSIGWNRTESVHDMLLSNIESPLHDTVRVIDSLWTKHTCEHFGFSAQKSIYKTCKTFKEFSLRVDWILNSGKRSTTSLYFGYPLEITYINTEYSFHGEVEQSYPIHVSRKASIKAAKGNLPYCTYLIPNIFHAELI